MSTDGLVWADFETGGLRIDIPVFEVAFVITDIWGQVFEEYESTICPMPKPQMIEYIDVMAAGAPGSPERFVYEMHANSRLWSAVLADDNPTHKVEVELIEWFNSHKEQYNLKFGDMPLCGNSVFMDHQWMNHTFPEVGSLFNHRNIDISSTKEMVKRRHPDVADDWKRLTESSTKPHRAMDDILHSIKEFQFYLGRGMIG